MTYGPSAIPGSSSLLPSASKRRAVCQRLAWAQRRPMAEMRAAASGPIPTVGSPAGHNERGRAHARPISQTPRPTLDADGIRELRRIARGRGLARLVQDGPTCITGVGRAPAPPRPAPRTRRTSAQPRSPRHGRPRTRAGRVRCQPVDRVRGCGQSWRPRKVPTGPGNSQDVRARRHRRRRQRSAVRAMKDLGGPGGAGGDANRGCRPPRALSAAPAPGRCRACVREP